MSDENLLYFRNITQWRYWLERNYNTSKGEFLVFYKVDSQEESMRWEDAVKVAICFGWIDSKVKKIDDQKRKQWFCPRKPKSVWSKLNKTYIVDLLAKNLIHESGLICIEIAKQNGSWKSIDAVENLEIPMDLQITFNQNENAFNNYKNFSKSYQKIYLHWLYQAKRTETRKNRIEQIIDLCEKNCKAR